MSVPPAEKQRPWRCRWVLTFFGLTDEYIESVYEEFFFLKQYGNWSFMEAHSLPVTIRKWFVKRLLKHMEMKNAPRER